MTIDHAAGTPGSPVGRLARKRVGHRFKMW